ncbi:hypothetical protein C7121_27890 [Paenibacillus glucanolyticus]|nr:hypothetical protein A3958_17160 [Paenibacillus glucanolyticus]AVV59679.1 hypothetical protein C7121_27890 [Paenibacillus glucanolyticus]ETT30376.1 hypothetical protein C169_28505 [Paenibacillus sp. FSL R5-808]
MMLTRQLNGYFSNWPMKHRRLIRDKDAKGVKGKVCLWLTRVVPRESNLSSLAINAMDDEVFLFLDNGIRPCLSNVKEEH